MSFKTISVTLTADVKGYTSGLGEAATATRRFGKDAESQVEASRKKQEEALKHLSRGAMLVGGAMVAGFGAATKAAANFDKEMSGVSAATGATADEMERLRESALKAGADTVFSASEAAKAQTELAKAGVATADILGGALVGSLSLASAGELDLARAAEISADAMTIFGLRGADVGHVADVLSAAAGKSSAEVEDMAAALNQTGLVAKSFGLSIEDTSGVLAMFAANGLKGSDAGTSFKTALQRLVPQSEEAARTMAGLGIDMFDAQGSFVGIEKAAEKLKTGLSGLTEEQRNAAMQTIFGADAVRAATILFRGGGAAVAEWRAKVDDSGYASEQAAKKLDNLSGDLEALGGSLETVFIKSGSAANGVLRAMAQETTQVVNAIGALPPSALVAGTAITGIAGAGIGLVGVVGTLAPKVAETREALDQMGRSGQFVSKHMGAMAKVTASSAVGIGLLLDALGKAQAASEKLVAELTGDVKVSSLESMLRATVDVEAELENLDREWAEMGNTADKILQGTIQVLTPMKNTVIDNAKAATDLSNALAELRLQSIHTEENLYGIANALGITTHEAAFLADKVGLDLTGGFQATRTAAVSAYDEMNRGSVTTQALGSATETLGEKVATAAERFKALRTAMDAVLGGSFDVEEATDSLTGRYLDLADAVAKNGASLDANTAEGLANREALRSLVEGAASVVEAQAEHGASNEALTKTLREQKARLEETLVTMGFSREEARRYARTLDEIKPLVATRVHVEGTADVVALKSAIDDLGISAARLNSLKFDAANIVAGARPYTGPDARRIEAKAAGGIVAIERAYARAGVLTMPTILAGEGRGSESYIPHDPSYRSTAVPVLHDTARALGFRAVPMAKGGWVAPMPSTPVSGGSQMDRAAVREVVREMVAALGPRVEVTQNNDFRGGDVPTAADMAYANRALGWELMVATGGG